MACSRTMSKLKTANCKKLPKNLFNTSTLQAREALEKFGRYSTIKPEINMQ